MINELAKKYAKAMYEAAKERSAVERIVEELAILSEAISKSPEAKSLMFSPVTEVNIKKQIFNKLTEDMHELSKGLVGVLLVNRREFLLSDTAESLRQIVNEKKGVTEGVVKSTVALNVDAMKKVEQVINKITSKAVHLKQVEDKSILGGIVVQVDGWTFDDSLSSHLNQMKEELNRRSL